MEFLVCMLLASILTGGRVATDLLHAVKGTTPAHVEKARLKAQQAPRGKAPRQRSPYAAGKPQLRDVAAVYWGDAMADAIDLHNRRREAKKAERDNPQPGQEKQPGLARQIWQRILNPVGNPQPTPQAPADEPTPKPDGPVITCDACGAVLVTADGGHAHPTGSRCRKVWAATPDLPSRGVVQASNEYKLAINHCWECTACGSVGLDYPTKEAADAARKGHTCDPAYADPDARERLHASIAYQKARTTAPRSPDNNNEGPATEGDPMSEASTRPGPPLLPGGPAGHFPPERPGTPAQPAPQQASKREPAPNAGLSAPTGEVANFETALTELDRLETAQQAHLDQAQAALAEIQQAKQRISDTQATYRPAAEAAAAIHDQLVALNLDPETVGNVGTVADAMPPNQVDVMFTQLESMEVAAQQQVANAEAALASTTQARTVILEKYSDAHATVAGELGGDARFLDGGGGYTTGAATASGNPANSERADAHLANPQS